MGKLMMEDIMVSVIVLTYGHEQYIAEALDSILKQKTHYRYEVIVGEDASPDNTRFILQKYEKAYPDIFTMIYRNTNVGGRANAKDLVQRASGKYIIALEGDDYWISEDKLERQVTFLEEHSQYVAVAHNCVVVDQNSVPTEEYYYRECKDAEYTLRLYRRNFMPGQSTTVLYRTELYKNIFEDKVWETKCLWGDWLIVLGAAARGPIYCMQDTMSAYRHITSGGTSYSANHRWNFSEISQWKDVVDYSRRLENKNAVIAAEGRYFALIFFEGLVKKGLSLRQAFSLYQYIDYKFRVLVIKGWDLVVRQMREKILGEKFACQGSDLTIRRLIEKAGERNGKN